MRVAIMQPYFLPYIGYWQLIADADAFVIYDNIKYTKHSWINRNRFLLNGEPRVFSLPLRHGPDEADVIEREIAGNYLPQDLMRRFEGAYKKAPHYAETMEVIVRVLWCKDVNLFGYIRNSVEEIAGHLGITTPIIRSSAIEIDHMNLKSQDKVLAICKALNATEYVNASGGVELYDRIKFQEQGIRLDFIRSKALRYQQFGETFVPWLSIVDVLMFNPIEQVREIIQNNKEIF